MYLWEEVSAASFYSTILIIHLWIHVITHLSKPTECITPRVNTNVNHGLQVIMMCCCCFTSCNKCTIVVWDVDSEGGWVGKGVYGNVLYLSLNFTMNIKLP